MATSLIEQQADGHSDELDLETLESNLAALTDEERQHFENLLTVRAYVLGWTGDPLCQPIESVRAAYRQMLQERAGGAR